MAAIPPSQQARVRIGTSGYVYRHWREVFYPEGLPARAWLGYYAERFPAVELNNTFYRLPTERAVESWARGTPEGFVFALKGSRYLTHVRRLNDRGRGVARFYTAIEPLAPKLGPILWQLPPTMEPDLERLGAFLDALPAGFGRAVEFRNAGWYRGEVFELLEQRRAALCLHDRLQIEGPFPPPGPFYYRRFHGAADHSGAYGPARLRRVAAEIAALARQGRECYAFFNNDLEGAAVRDAAALTRLVEEALGARGRMREARSPQDSP
jgi:uncharacterized protein YecE (DUF72 family)